MQGGGIDSVEFRDRVMGYPKHSFLFYSSGARGGPGGQG